MSRSSTTTQESTQTGIDPQLKDAYLSNLNQAKSVGNYITEQGPYTGDRAGAAPMGSSGQQAGDMLNTLANGIRMDIPQGAPGASIGQAWDMLARAQAQPWMSVGAYGYNPMPYQMQGSTVGAAESNIDTIKRGAVRDMGFDRIGNGMGQYMNAYSDSVINRGLQDLDRARQMQQRDNAAQAVRQGAFGGSRQAILESETNRGYADAAARMAAEQRAAGFNTAAGLSGQDIANAQRAAAANQAMDWQTAAANQAALNAGSESNANRSMQAAMASAQFGQQAGMANQQAALDAQRYNATARQQADQANQAANQAGIQQLLQMAQAYQGLAGTQFQLPMSVANALQNYDAYGRSVYDANAQARQAAFDDSRYYMMPALQLQSGALGINLPNLGMSSTGNSKTTYQPSGLQTLGQIAQIGGMFF